MMDKNQEIQELLIRLASSLKEEDLLEDPELEQEIKDLLQSMAPNSSLDPKVVSELSSIPDKKKRFLYAMKMLQVIPEPESMKALAEAMQSANLLSPGPVVMPGESPEHEPLEEGVSEEPQTEEDHGFDPEDASPADDVDISDKDTIAAATHRWR